MKLRFRPSVCLTAFFLLFASAVDAQITSGIISGLVTDESGAVLPGATVVVRDVETGISQTLVTDDAGRYVVSQLALGRYEVQAELVGFRKVVRSGITLTVGREAVVNIALSVGEISEKVVVSGEAPLVETTTTAIGGLVDDRKIRDLPLNGRNFAQLALLQTGVTFFAYGRESSSALNGTGLKFSVNGSRPNSNNFMLDGMNMADTGNSTPGSATGQNLGVEAIREFSVLTNTYSAAFGRNSGGVINIVSQSGTNAWHGSVFEFLRNSALDAKNFFDRLDLEIPHFIRNQFGFAGGGPIRTDKTFIFGNYEGLRERLGLSSVANVPNELARRGLIPDPVTKQLTDVGLNPKAAPYLNMYPLPNGRDFGDGRGEFLSGPIKRSNEDYLMLRADHQFSPSDSMFARYNFDNGSVYTPNSVRLFADTVSSRTQLFTLQEKRILSPTAVNTASFGFNRAFLNVESEPLTAEGKDPSLSFIPGRRFGLLSVSSLASLGGGGTPLLSAYNTFQYADDLRWSKGRHNIQVGALVSRMQNNIAIYALVGSWGFYSLNGLTELVQGRATSFVAQPATVVDPTSGQSFATERMRGWRQTNMGFYFQDDVRLRSNLSLNLGLRNESMTTVSEINGRQSNLRSPLASVWTLGDPIFNNPGLAWQPRIGLAWDPFGNGKTAVRAGFGVFNDIIIGQNYTLPARTDFPWGQENTVVTPPASSFPNAYALVSGVQAKATADHLYPDLKYPSKLHFNLNIQRELIGNTTVSVAYVGSESYHLFRRFDDNPAVAQYTSDGFKFFPAGSVRRNPNFDYNRATVTDVTGAYHSLQISVNRRFNKGFQFQASYTWSKSLDDTSQQMVSEGAGGYEFAMQFDNRKADRAVSNWNTPRNFVGNFTYQLPFGAEMGGAGRQLVRGWTINGIFTFADGPPFTALTGVNRSRNATLNTAEFVDQLPGRSSNPVLGGPDRYFDPTAFALPALGTFGKVGRNTLRGPGFESVDFAVTKLFSFTEEKGLQFRAELFNILNRPNFGRPTGTVFLSTGAYSGSAGRITYTVNTSRQLQFGLKFVF